MFEKKKKKRGELSIFAKFLLALVAVLLTVAILMTAYVTIFPAYDPAPVYPAPSGKMWVHIEGKVIDDETRPVFFQNISLSARVDSGDADGSVSNTITGTNAFVNTFSLDSYPTGCVWGSIELDDGTWHDFEFGLGNIEWGAHVEINVVVKETGVDFSAVASPSPVKPAGAPVPMMSLTCSPQLQYPDAP